MIKSFDTIVIGVGSMGAAACYYLASRGQRVLGLEQFQIPHEHGSHAGQSRIIRKAYFEHSDYVPLLDQAYRNWNNLEQESGVQIYYKTGLLYAGQKDGLLTGGVKESAAKYNIPIEIIPGSRFPQFNLNSGLEILFEPGAGFLTPEKAIAQYVLLAAQHGAEIHNHEPVLEWKKEGDGIQVKTSRGLYTCQSLIITAGAWAGKLIPTIASKLKVTRQVVLWLNPRETNSFELGNFPCWLIQENSAGAYYGFPRLPQAKFDGPFGIKVAYHYPGLSTDPNQTNRSISKAEEEQLIQAIQQYLPYGYASTVASKTCLYTNTPDEHFVIDYLPEHNNQVMIAAGFSGHGFKFASAVGEILAEMAIGNKVSSIDFLSLSRFTN